VLSPTWIEGIGVGVILGCIIEVVESIGLFNGEILKGVAKMTLIPIIPLNSTHFTNTSLSN